MIHGAAIGAVKVSPSIVDGFDVLEGDLRAVLQGDGTGGIVAEGLGAAVVRCLAACCQADGPAGADRRTIGILQGDAIGPATGRAAIDDVVTIALANDEVIAAGFACFTKRVSHEPRRD